MFSMSFSVTCMLTAFLAQTVLAVDKVVDPALDASLKTAATQLDRLALLSTNDDWLFDFTKQEKYTFSPGGVSNMNAATFPAATGQGLTMAFLNLGPCAQLPAHYHPRATNFVVSVLGNTTTYMYEENGARLVTEILTPGKATIFPQASIHTMQNNDCTNSQLISALNSDDAGTQNIGNIFAAGFPLDVIDAALGQGISNAANPVSIGTGSNLGSAECLARCGIQAKSTGAHRVVMT